MTVRVHIIQILADRERTYALNTRNPHLGPQGCSWYRVQLEIKSGFGGAHFQNSWKPASRLAAATTCRRKRPPRSGILPLWTRACPSWQSSATLRSQPPLAAGFACQSDCHMCRFCAIACDQEHAGTGMFRAGPAALISCFVQCRCTDTRKPVATATCVRQLNMRGCPGESAVRTMRVTVRSGATVRSAPMMARFHLHVGEEGVKLPGRGSKQGGVGVLRGKCKRTAFSASASSPAGRKRYIASVGP